MLLEDVFVSQSVLVSATRYINHKTKDSSPVFKHVLSLAIKVAGLEGKKHFLMEKLQL